MVLTTERLRIVPLTLPRLKLWVSDAAALEQELGCRNAAALMSDEFGRIVTGQYAAALSDRDNLLFYTFWLLITRTDGKATGSACFKGGPNAAGEVEIGYGLEKTFEKQGYMTEAVRELCKWALAQPDVRHIIAETDAENGASQRLLQRTGFRQYRSGATQWWRL